MILNSFDGFDDFNDFSQFRLDQFTNIVNKYNLIPEFFITKEDSSIIINEIWSNSGTDITANRIYEFDTFFIDIIPEEIRNDVLQEVLEIYVSDENYEEAAVLRDTINLL
jgi:hypothetical protein